MQTFIAFIVLLLLSSIAVAQPADTKISGIVKDARNEAMAGATVRLQQARDSSQVKSTRTDANGRFHFTGVGNGSFVLVVTSVGQRPYTGTKITVDPLHPVIVLPVIVLTPGNSAELAAVTVKTTRPLIEQEIDKTTVNVGSMISSATSNALEVLERTPGITVTSNGDISLNGRGGVLVLIDGRSTYMSGADLAAYLKSLPGSLLDKIELMDNPPARYDAAGNAIINIRLKKTRAGGLTGNFSSGYTQGRYARGNSALNLNYNHKKINVFGSLSYSHEKSYNDDLFDRKFYDEGNKLTSKVSLINRQVYKTNGTNMSIGADYTASANTTIGFLFNQNQNERNGKLAYNSDGYNAAQQLDTLSSGYVNSVDERSNYATNLNFVHKFSKPGSELSGDINYLRYTNDGDQASQNFIYQSTGVLSSANAFVYLLPSNINIYTAKLDYVQKVKTNMKFEAGLKSSIVDNDNTADYYNIINAQQVIDNSRSNHFKYHENIHAAYVNMQRVGTRVGLQMGLRVENTIATGRQLGNSIVPASTFTKDYTKLFPSMFVSYKLDSNGKYNLTFSITRRITRPNYQLLNPFVFFRDKYTYSSGNPLLVPQYQYRYELRYQHKQFLRLGLSYNRFTNVIFNITRPVDDVFISQPDNIAQGYMLLLNTGLNLSPAKWWSVNTDVLLSHIGLHGKAFTEDLNPNAYIARINLLNQLKLAKGWSAEFGGYYASKDLNGQAFTSAMVRLNAACQKKIWKDKGSIRLAIDDILHSWIYHNNSISLKQAQYYQTSESDTQRFGLAFTYRFGNDTFSRKRKHNDNAANEEKSRVD
jgi:hypothetical protein